VNIDRTHSESRVCRARLFIHRDT